MMNIRRNAICPLMNSFSNLSVGVGRRGGRVVYRGGLENRFGFTADGGSNPSLSASLRSVRVNGD